MKTFVIMATFETLVYPSMLNIFSIFFLRCRDVICTYIVLEYLRIIFGNHRNIPYQMCDKLVKCVINKDPKSGRSQKCHNSVTRARIESRLRFLGSVEDLPLETKERPCDKLLTV